MIDRFEKLHPAELWFHDGLRTFEAPGSFGLEDVDMTATQKIIAQFRQQGIKCTYTHVIVRAVALVFARHPEFNRLLLRNKLVYPATVDISLSVYTGLSIGATPEIILNDVVRKDLAQITQETIELAAQVRAGGDLERLEKLRRISRVIRVGWMRRALYRMMKSRMSMIRKRIGTFHVTSVPFARQGTILKYATPAAITIARVEDHVVVRDGQAVIRPICTLGFIVDDRLWSGVVMGTFLTEIKKILEDGEIGAELPQSEETA
nr:2-oxo acid dehydrogenase subunit E2 [Ktedonobacteraceae bacterium]